MMTTRIKLGLLGNGINRSRAKYLHELLGEQQGLPVTYQPMDLAGKAEVQIRDELLRCRDEGFRGLNVTHPHKRTAFDCVAMTEDFPHGLTAINTVIFTEWEMLGQNTDYSGFCRAFRQQFGKNIRPGKVLMLGAGGVGLALAHGLHTLGADEVMLYDKQAGLATELQQQLPDCDLRVTVLTQETDIIPAMQAADGLVNATPLGMHQYPGSAFPEAGFKQQRWAFDAVYTPENTRFLQHCRERGIETLSGFKLFLFQGLDAFRHFTGIEADANQTEQDFLRRYPLDKL